MNQYRGLRLPKRIIRCIPEPTDMTTRKPKDGFFFHEPGIYLIQVFGTLGKSLSDCLGHMNIATDEHRDFGTVTSIEGKMRDQAELTGVLNMLYEHRFRLLSVQFVDRK